MMIEKNGNAEKTITIVGTDAEEYQARGERGLRGGRAQDVVERTVGITKVRDRFERFLDGLSEVINVSVPAVGDFSLDEVEFRAEITADGDFKLLGTGVGIAATSGVTFTLRRRP